MIIPQTLRKKLQELNLELDEPLIDEEKKRKFIEGFDINSEVEKLSKKNIDIDYSLIKTKDTKDIYIIVAKIDEGKDLKAKIAKNLKTGEWVLCKSSKEKGEDKLKTETKNRIFALKALDRYRGIAEPTGYKTYLFEKIVLGDHLAYVLEDKNKMVYFNDRFKILYKLIEEHKRLVDKKIYHGDFAALLQNLFYYHDEEKDFEELNFIDFGELCARKETTKRQLLGTLVNVFEKHNRSDFSAKERFIKEIFSEQKCFFDFFLKDMHELISKYAKQDFDYQHLVMDIKEVQRKYNEIHGVIFKFNELTKKMAEPNFVFSENCAEEINEYFRLLYFLVNNSKNLSFEAKPLQLNNQEIEITLNKILNFLHENKQKNLKNILEEFLSQGDFIFNYLFLYEKFDVFKKLFVEPKNSEILLASLANSNFRVNLLQICQKMSDFFPEDNLYGLIEKVYTVFEKNGKHFNYTYLVRDLLRANKPEKINEFLLLINLMKSYANFKNRFNIMEKYFYRMKSLQKMAVSFGDEGIRGFVSLINDLVDNDFYKDSVLLIENLFQAIEEDHNYECTDNILCEFEDIAEKVEQGKNECFFVDDDEISSDEISSDEISSDETPFIKYSAKIKKIVNKHKKKPSKKLRSKF